MFRKIFTNGAFILLAGGVLFWTTGAAQARGGGGGFHAGGFRGGGFRGGAFSPGGFRAGGYRLGGYGAGAYSLGGYRYSGYHPYTGFRRSYYGGYPYFYGAYPYSYGAYLYPYYPTASPGLVAPASHVGEAAAAPPVTTGGSTSEGYYPAATAQPQRAFISVTVPQGTRLWFEGHRIHSTGHVRKFESPPLTPGQRYVYDIKATWKEHGHEVTQTRELAVSSGEYYAVQFHGHSAKHGNHAAHKKGNTRGPSTAPVKAQTPSK
jgi:uncharacterized protein (TIGR03000 family)